MSIYKNVLEKFGHRNQITKSIEELSELAVQLAKRLNGLETKDIEGEIADVHIMLEQLKFLFPMWDGRLVDKLFKLDKLCNPNVVTEELRRCQCEEITPINPWTVLFVCGKCKGLRPEKT